MNPEELQAEAAARLGRGDRAGAAAAFRTLIAQVPHLPGSYYNLGNALREQGDFAAAARSYSRALAINPGQRGARWNRGLCLLPMGQLDQGWLDFESRFKDLKPTQLRYSHLPLWRGERLAGRRLVIWQEQGIGDEMAFASCYGELLATGADVRLDCDPRLHAIFERSYPGLSCGSRFAGDVQAPSGTVARHLRPTVASFAGGRGLTPDPARARRWRGWLAHLQGLRVGICWSGLLRTPERADRYASLEDLLPILALPGCSFVALQYGEPANDLAAFEARHRLGICVPDFDLKDDIEGLAAVASGLDLVIGPGTALTALSAAVGTPTWCFEPADDWMTMGTGQFPWAPAMRLYQRAGAGYADIIARMATDLGALMGRAGRP